MKHILVDFGRLELLGLSIPIRLYGYGLMLILGFILSIYIARRRARRMGESVEVLYNLGILALIGGIVGARLAYVIEKWDSEIAGVDNKLFAIFDISSGGLIYFGGLVLGAAFVFLFMVKKRLPVRRYIDIVAVSLMVGLAFGRLGCFTRGCCYGGKADAGWALSMEFPMYAEPYAKFDGRDNNPWPRGDRGTSPPYGEQMKNKEIQPDEHLFLVGSKVLVSQEDLHGELDRDQLVMFDMTREQIRQAGQEIAGPDGKIDYDDWSQALKTGEALTGSEHWNVGLYYDLDKDSLISVEEFVGYATDRNAKILKRFDRDRTGNGTLTTAERLEANKFLQADQISIARASHSHPVKPAQLLGFANSIILAILLTLFYRLRRREGQVFALLLVIYPITRFVLESIRSDNHHNVMKLQLTHNQVTSILLMVVGIALFITLQCCVKPSAGPCWNERLKQ